MAVSWRIKIALCAKCGATEIELVGVDTTKGRGRFLWPRPWQRPGPRTPEVPAVSRSPLKRSYLGSFLIPSGFGYEVSQKIIKSK